MRRVLFGAAALTAVVAAVVATGACGSPTSDVPAPSPQRSPSPGVVEGIVGVAGHGLHIRCSGTGVPTVVFLHGADPGLEPTEYAAGIEEDLATDHRFCVYDRPDVGRSETGDTPQTPTEMVADLGGVLTAVGEDGPYLLLGADAGGLLAYAYAAAHPDKVMGIVALDSTLPTWTQDRSYPSVSTVTARASAGTTPEATTADALRAHVDGLAGREPRIPLTYLASTQEPESATELRAQHAFVDRFSPGKLVQVDAPHFMEPVIPTQIADAVRDVAREAGWTPAVHTGFGHP